MDVYTKENKDFHFHNTGSPGTLNPKCKITEQDVKNIRKLQKEDKTLQEVYKMYSDKLTNGGFHSIWSGKNWKNII